MAVVHVKLNFQFSTLQTPRYHSGITHVLPYCFYVYENHVGIINSLLNKIVRILSKF
jgi:hypothetical protein